MRRPQSLATMPRSGRINSNERMLLTVELGEAADAAKLEIQLQGAWASNVPASPGFSGSPTQSAVSEFYNVEAMNGLRARRCGLCDYAVAKLAGTKCHTKGMH